MASRVLANHFVAAAPQSYGESIRQRGLGGDFRQIDAQMNDGLRDLRTDAADQAIGAHQTRRGHGLQQVLRHQRIHHRDAGDIDDGEIRARLDDRFQQILHHHLRSRAVQRSDQRQRQNVLPQPHHGSGKLQQFLLLARDHIFARLLECFRGEQPEFVDQSVACQISSAKAASASLPNSLLQRRKERLLERKNEGSRFPGRVTVLGPAPEKSTRKSRTPAHSVPEISPALLFCCSAPLSDRTNSRDCRLACSRSAAVSFRPVACCCSIHWSVISCSRFSKTSGSLLVACWQIEPPKLMVAIHDTTP